MYIRKDVNLNPRMHGVFYSLIPRLPDTEKLRIGPGNEGIVFCRSGVEQLSSPKHGLFKTVR